MWGEGLSWGLLILDKECPAEIQCPWHMEEMCCQKNAIDIFMGDVQVTGIHVGEEGGESLRTDVGYRYGDGVGGTRSW